MNKINHFFIGGQNFRKEFIRQFRMLVVVTIGFTIAFSWRQTIFDAIEKTIETLFRTSQVYSSILTSTFITLLGLLIILLSSYLVKENNG